MTNELNALQERIAELQEQNESLRQSATTFAQLAERLNERLRVETARGRRLRAKTLLSKVRDKVSIAV